MQGTKTTQLATSFPRFCPTRPETGWREPWERGMCDKRPRVWTDRMLEELAQLKDLTNQAYFSKNCLVKNIFLLSAHPSIQYRGL